jgi:hypothetical protein
MRRTAGQWRTHPARIRLRAANQSQGLPQADHTWLGYQWRAVHPKLAARGMTMDERRRRRLAREYQRLQEQYAHLFNQFGCGVELAEHISPNLAKWGRRMREIEAEIRAAMRGES